MTEPDEQNPYRPPNFNAAPEADELPEPPEGLIGKLVVLSTFESAIEAHFFKNELENHGIRAAVGNETSTAIFGPTIGGPSSAFWIEVLVLEEDAERGLEVKKEWNSKSDNSEQVEISEWTCECGETVDEGFAVCWSCGAEYNEEAS